MHDEYDNTYYYIIDNHIATKNEVSLVTSINGCNIEALNSILYCRTGYRDLEQILDCE